MKIIEVLGAFLGKFLAILNKAIEIVAEFSMKDVIHSQVLYCSHAIYQKSL